MWTFIQHAWCHFCCMCNATETFAKECVWGISFTSGWRGYKCINEYYQFQDCSFKEKYQDPVSSVQFLNQEVWKKSFYSVLFRYVQIQSVTTLLICLGLVSHCSLDYIKSSLSQVLQSWYVWVQSVNMVQLCLSSISQCSCNMSGSVSQYGPVMCLSSVSPCSCNMSDSVSQYGPVMCLSSVSPCSCDGFSQSIQSCYVWVQSVHAVVCMSGFSQSIQSSVMSKFSQSTQLWYVRVQSVNTVLLCLGSVSPCSCDMSGFSKSTQLWYVWVQSVHTFVICVGLVHPWSPDMQGSCKNMNDSFSSRHHLYHNMSFWTKICTPWLLSKIFLTTSISKYYHI